MDYLGLTNTAQIRATLTIGEEDLDDEQIDGYGLDDDLGEALDTALKGLAQKSPPTTWQEIAAEPANPNSRRLRLFAKFFCAGTLAVTAQSFVLKKIADGSNEAQRSDKDGFAWMAPTLFARAQGYLDQLVEDLGITPEPLAPFSIMKRVVPGRDPITEPRSAV